MERSRTLPAQRCHGAWGDPWGGLGEGARYLSHTFAGRVSKFFSKYSPGAAARRAAPPSALHGGKRGRGGSRGNTRGSCRADPHRSPFFLDSEQAYFLGREWGFLVLFALLSLRSFPEDGTVAACPWPGGGSRIPLPTPIQTGIPSPKRPARKVCVGRTSV